jgi:hypothetical protein
MFFMGKYEGIMLIAISINADRQLVPLAFAIVEKDNNGSWGWFLHLVRRVVVGPRREICVISDMHARILNATNPTTTDEHVKRAYVLRIRNPSLIYFRLCPLFCTLMYVLHIYLFHYAQCVVYFIYSIITHCFQTW